MCVCVSPEWSWILMWGIVFRVTRSPGWWLAEGTFPDFILFLSLLRAELCSCGSVVEHCVSSAKGCGFNSQGTHILIKKCIAWVHCKCINVNVNIQLKYSKNITQRNDSRHTDTIMLLCFSFTDLRVMDGLRTLRGWMLTDSYRDRRLSLTLSLTNKSK